MSDRLEVIFADDIRREDNGKLLLIGVYADALVLGTMPSTFPIALWVRIYKKLQGHCRFHAEVAIDDHPQHIFYPEVVLEEEGSYSQLIIAGLPIAVSHPGTLSFSLSDKDGIIDKKTLSVMAPPIMGNG